jgi:hypothetical protein
MLSTPDLPANPWDGLEVIVSDLYFEVLLNRKVEMQGLPSVVQ